MVFAGSSPITTTSPSSKAHQKSGPFPQPALPGFNGHTTPSDSRHGRRLRDVEAATLALDGSPPITRTTFPTCRAHYPGGSSGCACRLLPRSHSLPQMAGGSASALSLSRPAQASLTLRPTGLLNRLKRPLSRGSSPAGYPAEPLVSYQINRQLSGWNLPPLVIRAFGAHCHQLTSRVGFDGIASTHQFSAVLRTIGVATTNLHAGCEQAFVRYMIYLQPCTVRILKQHRIVARGEAVLAWLMNNFCADFD